MPGNGKRVSALPSSGALLSGRPRATPVKHTHPGKGIIYLLEGSLEYQVEGQPARTCNAGGALTVPAGVVHAAWCGS